VAEIPGTTASDFTSASTTDVRTSSSWTAIGTRIAFRGYRLIRKIGIGRTQVLGAEREAELVGAGLFGAEIRVFGAEIRVFGAAVGTEVGKEVVGAARGRAKVQGRTDDVQAEARR